MGGRDRVHRRGLAVHSMSPRSVHDVGAEVRALAERVDGAGARRRSVRDEWDAWMASVLTPRWYDAFIAVWRRPWMSLASDTYGVVAPRPARREQRVRRLGRAVPGGHARRGRGRGRRTSILLPSEPYEFGPEHAREIEREVAGVPIVVRRRPRSLLVGHPHTPRRRPPRPRPACVPEPHSVWVWDAARASARIRGGSRGRTVSTVGGQVSPGIARYLLCETCGPGRGRTWGVVGASLLVFTAGPAAIAAIPCLQRAHLIADTPLWLLVALLVACSVANAVVQTFEKRLSPDARPAPARRRPPRSAPRGSCTRPGGDRSSSSATASGSPTCCACTDRARGAPGSFWSGVAIFGGRDHDRARHRADDPRARRSRTRSRSPRSSASRSSPARSARRPRPRRRPPRRSSATGRTSAISCSTRPT